MYLCIDSTERNNHHLILFEKGDKKETYADHPFLLVAIENFLESVGVSKKEIQGIAVVVGKGTFSSIRMATTLANAWHYSLHIPIISIPSEGLDHLDSCAEELQSQKDSGYILPTYSGPPNIGSSK